MLLIVFYEENKVAHKQPPNLLYYLTVDLVGFDLQEYNKLFIEEIVIL